MNERIELLENGNTLITAPIEFHYEDGRKRIFFAGRPDDPPMINEQLVTGIARAYRWQELLDSGEFDSPEALAEALNVNVSYVQCFLQSVNRLTKGRTVCPFHVSEEKVYRFELALRKKCDKL